jgi:phosphosulfolactate synthase
LDELNKNRIDDKKPRREGLTCIIDKLQSLDKDSLEALAPFIDIVKIYGAIPLLVSEAVLEKKIKFYHDFGMFVSIGSIVTEYCILENSFDKLVKEATKSGFDILEIGENTIEMSTEQRKNIIDTMLSEENLNFQWKVGKKDPRHQLTAEEMLSKIDDALKIGSYKIVIEANKGISAGIYDEKGLVKWNLVGAVTSKYPPSTFIFEAPMEYQQSALLAEFGQRVNLSEINPDAIMSVESQRRGFLSKATFEVSYLRQDPKGSPAAKFIYYIIRTRYPIDQGELMRLSRLPRRTIQNVIDDLKNQGVILERNSLDDARKKIYTPVRSDWL